MEASAFLINPPRGGFCKLSVSLDTVEGAALPQGHSFLRAKQETWVPKLILKARLIFQKQRGRGKGHQADSGTCTGPQEKETNLPGWPDRPARELEGTLSLGSD